MCEATVGGYVDADGNWCELSSGRFRAEAVRTQTGEVVAVADRIDYWQARRVADVWARVGGQSGRVRGWLAVDRLADVAAPTVYEIAPSAHRVHLHARHAVDGLGCATECGLACDRVPVVYRDLIDSPADVTCTRCRSVLLPGPAGDGAAWAYAELAALANGGAW